VIFNMMGDDDDSGPLSTALGSPYFLAIATGEGMLHPWKDYEAALRDVGFKQTVRLDQGLPMTMASWLASNKPTFMEYDYFAAFSRTLGFLSSEELGRLRNARVAIAGLGGTGGAQVHALARMGVGNLTWPTRTPSNW